MSLTLEVFTRHHPCLTLLCKQLFFGTVACLLVSTCYTHNYLETPLDGQREEDRTSLLAIFLHPKLLREKKVFGKKIRFLFNIARFPSCFSALKLVFVSEKKTTFLSLLNSKHEQNSLLHTYTPKRRQLSPERNKKVSH